MAAILSLALTGCGTLSPTVLTSEKDWPEGSAQCSKIDSIYGNARFAAIKSEKGALKNGTIAIDTTTCNITMTGADTPPKPVPVVVVPPHVPADFTGPDGQRLRIQAAPVK